MSLCYLCSVVLTFDQSASLICFSPLTACEQELYKHVLPPREANGSLLITGEAGRRAVHSHRCCGILLGGSTPGVCTSVLLYTRILTNLHTQQHTWQVASHVKWGGWRLNPEKTNVSSQVLFLRPCAASCCQPNSLQQNSSVQFDSIYLSTSDKLSSQTCFSSPVSCGRHVTHLSLVSLHPRAQRQ